MSCTTVRHRLLACERPDKPAAAETRHLASCADCRVWLRRLVRLEQQLSLVPVPPSAPPPALLAMLNSAPADVLVKPPALLHAVRPRQESGRQKLSLALALAAALAVFAVGWWAWPHVQPPSRTATDHFSPRNHDALVAAALKSAHTPPKRVTALTDLADEFFKKAQDNPDDLFNVRRQALHFRRVLKHDLPSHAREVSFGDRPMLKDIASRLGQIEGNAARLAREWNDRYPASAKEMRQIATEAAEAERLLRQMAPV